MSKEKKILSADSPRPDCADCVRKHLGQAAALIQESMQGYPDHFWLAIGHLAEAETESQGRWPEFAVKLRTERKKMETDEGYVPDCVELINEVTTMVMQESSNKEAGQLVKLAKSLIAAPEAPMTDEQKDWYDELELHLERIKIDGNSVSEIDVNNWEDALLMEASYGRYDKAWIAIEVSPDKTLVDLTPSGETNPVVKQRIRGSNYDRPQIAKRLINKVVKDYERSK